MTIDHKPGSGFHLIVSYLILFSFLVLPMKASGAPVKNGKKVTKEKKVIKNSPVSAETDRSNGKKEVKTETLTTIRKNMPEISDKFTQPHQSKGGRTLSLPQAVSKGLQNNPRILIAKSKIKESLMGVEAAKRNILPKIQLSGNAIYWDSALKFSLGTPTDITPPSDCPLGCLLLLNQIMSSFDMGNIRDQFTAQFTFTVAQPITAAFAILKIIKAKKLGVKVSKIEENLKKLKIRYDIERAYIKSLQIRKYAEIANSSINLIKAHLKIVKLFYDSQLVGKTELLKVKVALGNAMQKSLEAESGIALSESLLKMLMGDTSKTNYVLSQTFPEPASKFHLSLQTCYDNALNYRPELKMLATQLKIIDESYNASRIMLLPGVNVLAQYQRSQGMGVFTPKNTWFVGVNFSWTWEWNKKFIETDMILAKKSQVNATLKEVSRALKLNVKKNWLGVRTSLQKIAIAKISLKAAMETLRLERIKFGSKLKTSTSLLDAQTRYDASRIMLAAAIYDYYLNLAGLKEAMGVKKL